MNSPNTPTAIDLKDEEVINPVLAECASEINKEQPDYELSVMESQQAQRASYSVVINALHSSEAEAAERSPTTTTGSKSYQPIANDIHPALPEGRLHHHYHRHHPHKLRWENIPWLEMFTNPASLALLLNSFAQGWVGLIILTEMPTFLNQQLGKYEHFCGFR